MKRFTRKRRLAVAALLALVVAIAGGAYTAANTIASGGNAGDGNATISGFTITGVSYGLQAGDPTFLSGVSFDVAPAASTVTARVNAAGAWLTCSLVAGTRWNCPIAASTQTVLSATDLRVIATS